MLSWIWTLLLALSLALAEPYEEDPQKLEDEYIRGYPLFFGSFEDVGDSIIDHTVIELAEADRQITEWLTGCKADAFLLVRDAAPFDIGEMSRVKRLGEKSLTKGSFLTDYPLNLRELSLDLEDYCGAERIDIDIYDKEPVKPYMDVRPRVFYLEFRPEDSDLNKDEIIKAVLRHVPTPYVTVIYDSSYAQQKPVLRSIHNDQRRKKWKGAYDQKHNPNKVQPIIAPLFDKIGPKDRGHAAPEPSIDIPDHFFMGLLVASIGGVGFMILRNLFKQ